MDYLGSECSIPGCGISDPRMLQIDHKGGGGNHEIKKFGSHQRMLKYYLDHPEEAMKNLQVLCCNHNWARRFEGQLLVRRAAYIRLCFLFFRCENCAYSFRWHSPRIPKKCPQCDYRDLKVCHRVPQQAVYAYIEERSHDPVQYPDRIEKLRGNSLQNIISYLDGLGK